MSTKSPRVTDGLCPERCTADKPVRISSQYKEGKGDLQFFVEDESELFYRDLLYGKLEAVKHSILECPLYISDGETLAVLKWLVQATYALSASLHLIASNDEYAYLYCVSDREVEEMERAIKNWKAKLGHREEFCHYSVGVIEGKDVSKGSRILDECRTKVREAHTIFRQWRSYYEQVGGFSKNLEANGKFLNRLSSYLFWAAAWEAELNGLKPTYWCRKMPEFPKLLIDMQTM